MRWEDEERSENVEDRRSESVRYVQGGISITNGLTYFPFIFVEKVRPIL